MCLENIMTFHFKCSKQGNMRKTNGALRALSVLFLIIAISPLACTPTATPTGAVMTATEQFNTPTAAEIINSALTFTAEADAQVNEENPDNNAGNSTFLQVDGASEPAVESFIRFTVTGTSGTIQSARLRVYDTTNASDNGPAIYATGAAWTETEITWNNRPERTSEELDNKSSISTETWVEYDVTGAVTGDGTFSFVLAADSSDAATFSSREGSQSPELMISLAGSSTPVAGTATEAATATVLSPSATSTSGTPLPGGPLLFMADADARVKESSPTTNYGDDNTLQVDGAGDPGIESFIRFTVTGVSGPFQSARLRVYVADNGTQDGPAVYSTSNSWTENEITWDNRPDHPSDPVDNKEHLGTNGWVEYDVTSLVTGNGTFSFVLVADSTDGVIFSSREGEQPPQLALTLQGSDVSTSTVVPTVISTLPTDDVTLVGAGDISVCDNDSDELTAQLLDGIPGTVFTTGDNAYESGTIEEFNNCYGPTWGRHKDRTKPVPGNHEYLTADAEGYFQYFNNIPSYYVYTLGSWRIYALNSEIDVSETSPQITWLKADLASNPAQCVLAYWHQPRWSSGTHHGSDKDYQTLWQILYEAGADLVLNGHEHNYERFAEMNAEGAAVSPGLREIVVGTGGRDLYELGSPLPASEVRESSTFGVLKLTLRPDGYDWEFIPAAGSTFTDSGSTSCH
jgi:calcineurin-like phosphoesterase family protein